jgi:hypothetical protein
MSTAAVEKDLEYALQVFAPLRRTALDIWMNIFKLVFRSEFEDYIKQNDGKTLRPTPYLTCTS